MAKAESFEKTSNGFNTHCYISCSEMVDVRMKKIAAALAKKMKPIKPEPKICVALKDLPYPVDKVAVRKALPAVFTTRKGK